MEGHLLMDIYRKTFTEGHLPKDIYRRTLSNQSQAPKISLNYPEISETKLNHLKQHKSSLITIYQPEKPQII